MRSEAHFVDHLAWMASGTVWATWRISPLLRPPTAVAAQRVSDVHSSLFRSIAGHEFLLSGLLTWTDPISSLDAVIGDVDLAECPMWATEADATIEAIADLPLGQRTWYLSVRLSKVPSRVWWRTLGFAGVNWALGTVGQPSLPPTAGDIHAYLDAAAVLEQQFPSEFAANRVGVDEQLRIRRHLVKPGSVTLGECGLPTEGFASASGVDELLLDEGAVSDLAKQGERLRGARARRVLKISSGHDEVSYRAGMVLGQLPQAMVWPTSEFLGHVDDTGIPVDVAIRGIVRDRFTAMKLNDRARGRLTDQLDQTDGADGQQESHLHRLHHAASVLTSYQSELDAHDQEVEIEAVVALSVPGETAEIAVDLAVQVRNSPMFRSDFTWAAPLGAQVGLFSAFRPGAPVSALVRDYRQISRTAMWAASNPVTAPMLGRHQGIPLAVNVTSPLHSLVFIDLFADARARMSPSLAVVGEQGSGKSMLQKRMCAAVVARGGRMFATDNSAEREWVRFAQALGVPCSVVDVASPQASLDPLRVLPAEQAAAVVQSFLITLLNVVATDQLGRTIAKVVKPSYLAAHQLTSMGDLHRHLVSGDCTLPGAEEVGDRIGVFTDLDMAGSLAAAVFDPTLPPLDLTADAIVIGTSSVALPTGEELSQAHLFAQLGVDKIFGRALYALIARLARQVGFASNTEETIFNVDELHHMTTSHEAQAVIVDFVRYGRRALAALCTGSHNPETDYPDPTVRNLIKHRLVLRSPQPDLAAAGARFLGIDPDQDPEGFSEYSAEIMGISNETPGVGLYRDPAGQLGVVQLLPPATPAHRAAAETTPPAKVKPGALG